MPGITVRIGTKTFGKAPMIGVSRAAWSSLAAKARCTSAKFVVQYPNDRQNARPKMIPTQSPMGLSPPNPVPAHGSRNASPSVLPSFSHSPENPPTSDNAT